MILIVTQEYDSHADLVTEQLDRRGVPYMRFNTAEMATGARLSLDNCAHQMVGTLESGSKSVALDQVTSVWFRRGLLLPENESCTAALEGAVRAAVTLLAGRLQDCFWVNPYWPDQRAHAKPYQLAVAAKVGLDIPRTLITNRPNDAADFCHSCGGEIIYKAAEPYHVKDDQGGIRALYTSKVTQGDLRIYAPGISMVPCVFQECLRKQSEIRVTVVGSKVFAAELIPRHSSVDIRLARHDTSCRPTTIPQEALLQAGKLLRRLGLVFASMDFVKTTDGRFVFLEVNPSGQWYWVEQLTGMPILDAVVELLLNPPEEATISQ
jgi:hypothetical protein